MTLAIFDLDNTLIAGDSDTSWGDFLSEHGYVDQQEHTRKHEKYYRDYLDGTLNIMEFLEFQLEILSQHDLKTLQTWRAKYLEVKIKPLMLDKAISLVEKHRQQGDHLLIITATNRFITEPIAAMLGISDLIATEPEMINGQYTGRVEGTPSFAEGKVTRLAEWLAESVHSLEGSWFYSDSHNDIPLLEQVDRPVAVDPDDKLRDKAEKKGWKILSLREL